jgi:hypothetical protein
VGQTRHPQLPDDVEPLVDDVVVHLGVSDLHGAVEHLGHEQVLALRGDLDDPVRLRYRQAGVAHDPQHVVLVLHQPTHGVERLLVLQPAVQQGATELVPTVGAHVAHRVQLREQVTPRLARDRDTHRGGATGSGQPERRHLDRDHTELVVQRLFDRPQPAAGQIEVGGAAAPVGHRVHGRRGEQPERGQRDRDPEHHPVDDVGGRVLRQVQP